MHQRFGNDLDGATAYDMAMKAGNQTVGARLRVVLKPDVAMGPGKADLLEGIEKSGSIAAAGRTLGMSYKRAWTLVESLNAAFGMPLVETQRGGNRRGGAVLTDMGKRILSLYRRMEAQTHDAIGADIDAMRKLLKSPAD